MWFNRAKSGGVSWLLVFLGNPGKEYENTRHNMGFWAADALESKAKISINRLKYKALTATCTLGGEQVLAMKPQTYMNLSGEAVGEAARFYKIPPEKVIVIYDDVSLPAGKLRVRPSGSAGGHNGIKSIISHLGSDKFPRVKIGVGAPQHPDHEMVDWVIGKITAEEKKALLPATAKAVDAAECIIEKDVSTAMNRFNG